MQRLSDFIQGVARMPRGYSALPDEAQCPYCRGFDIAHPAVRAELECRVTPARTWEFWIKIAQCQCERLEEAKRALTALRRQQAGLPAHTPRTFANFTVEQGTREAVDAADSLSRLQGPRALVLMGGTGRGKSHLLEAIIRARLDAGDKARYDTAASIMDRLRDAQTEYAEETVQRLMYWYQAMRLLAIDDLGMERAKDFAAEYLTRLVDERIRNGWWLVVATNLDRQGMADHLGDRLASRLYQTNEQLAEVRVAPLTCGDYRARK